MLLDPRAVGTKVVCPLITIFCVPLRAVYCAAVGPYQPPRRATGIFDELSLVSVMECKWDKGLW